MNYSYAKLSYDIATKGVNKTLDDLSGSWSPYINLGKAVITRNPLHISASTLLLGAIFYRRYVKNKASRKIAAPALALYNNVNTIELQAVELKDNYHEIPTLYPKSKLSKMPDRLRDKHLIDISRALRGALTQAESVKCAAGSYKNHRRIIINLRRRLERVNATANAFGIDVGQSKNYA